MNMSRYNRIHNRWVDYISFNVIHEIKFFKTEKGGKTVPKAKRYSMEQIREAQKILRGLKGKNAGKTRAETVELLAEDIRKVAQQGYSLQEIRELLEKAGIAVPLSRLKALWDKAVGELGQKVESTPGGGVSLFPAASEKEPEARTGRSAIQGMRGSE